MEVSVPKISLSGVALLILLLFGSSALAAEEGADVFAAWGPLEVRGEDRPRFDVAAGAFDFGKEDVAALRWEGRGGRKLGFVGPAAGVLATLDSSVYGYVGVFADLAVHRLVLTPLFGVGLYHDGGGKDLGGTLEFRSALTIAWEMESGARTGVQFAHISNADLHDENPGANELLLSFSIPF
jgi:hypothetical protein